MAKNDVDSYESKIGKRLALIIVLAIAYMVIYNNFFCDFSHKDFLDKNGQIDLAKYKQQEGKSCSDFTYNSWSHVLYVLLIYFASEYMIWISRYHMPHLTVNGHSGSILGRPVIKGDYAIIGTGKNLFPVPLPYPLATVVLPRWHLARAGNNLVGLTYVELQNSVDEVPEICAETIKNNPHVFNKKHVYYGEFTEGELKVEPRNIAWLARERKKNQRINELRNILEGRYDSFEEIKNVAADLAGEKYSLKRVISGKTKQEEDE